MHTVAFKILITSTLLLNVLRSSPAGAQEALPDRAPVPADNPMTPAKIELGKQLFFDPRLSRSGVISCNSCHNVMAGGDDNRSLSIGFKAQLGGRSAPTVWNSAFKSIQFWDGRAATLEEQAKGPIINPVEMGMDKHAVAIDRIRVIPGYVKAFEAVFGTKEKISIDHAVKAIAAYERTLITPNSRFDKYIKGDKSALTKAEVEGFETFKSTGCVACHSGPNFSGPSLPIGTGFFQKFPMVPDAEIEKKYGFAKDLGRFEVTKADADKNIYVVQTLRNIALTAPYFHNGKVPTLNEAVTIMAKLQLGKDLKKVEVEKIVTFLKTLTGEFPQQLMPRLPETPGSTLLTD
jgi:cytochrome c peroxidase